MSNNHSDASKLVPVPIGNGSYAAVPITGSVLNPNASNYVTSVLYGPNVATYTQQYPGGPLILGPQPNIQMQQAYMHPTMYPAASDYPVLIKPGRDEFTDAEMELAEKIMEECDAPRAP
jgi:hypothetical protein